MINLLRNARVVVPKRTAPSRRCTTSRSGAKSVAMQQLQQFSTTRAAAIDRETWKSVVVRTPLLFARFRKQKVIKFAQDNTSPEFAQSMQSCQEEGKVCLCAEAKENSNAIARACIPHRFKSLSNEWDAFKIQVYSWNTQIFIFFFFFASWLFFYNLKILVLGEITTKRIARWLGSLSLYIATMHSSLPDWHDHHSWPPHRLGWCTWKLHLNTNRGSRSIYQKISVGKQSDDYFFFYTGKLINK